MCTLHSQTPIFWVIYHFLGFIKNLITLIFFHFLYSKSLMQLIIESQCNGKKPTWLIYDPICWLNYDPICCYFLHGFEQRLWTLQNHDMLHQQSVHKELLVVELMACLLSRMYQLHHHFLKFHNRFQQQYINCKVKGKE